MALENCFQVMSSATSAAPLKLNIGLKSPSRGICSSLASRGSKRPSLSFSSSSSLSSSVLQTGKLRKLGVTCQAKEAVGEAQAVTESSWDSLVLGSQVPVLVDFWAPWCGPCRLIAPIIDELAKEYSGKIACYKLNTDESPNIAAKYGIRSIPTVLFFKNGERKESVIGAVPKLTLSNTVDKYLDD